MPGQPGPVVRVRARACACVGMYGDGWLPSMTAARQPLRLRARKAP